MEHIQPMPEQHNLGLKRLLDLSNEISKFANSLRQVIIPCQIIESTGVIQLG